LFLMYKIPKHPKHKYIHKIVLDVNFKMNLSLFFINRFYM